MRELLFSEMRSCSGVVCVQRPGFFAQAGADGCYVFMVADLWTRCGGAVVDVSPLPQHRDTGPRIAWMRDVKTMPVSALHHIGSHSHTNRLSRGQRFSLTFD